MDIKISLQRKTTMNPATKTTSFQVIENPGRGNQPQTALGPILMNQHQIALGPIPGNQVIRKHSMYNANAAYRSHKSSHLGSSNLKLNDNTGDGRTIPEITEQLIIMGK